MPKPVTSEEFMPVVRGLVRVVAGSIIESAALQIAVKTALSASFGELFERHLQAARETVREQWKPMLTSLDAAAPESLLSILEKFEGPLQ